MGFLSAFMLIPATLSVLIFFRECFAIWMCLGQNFWFGISSISLYSTAQFILKSLHDFHISPPSGWGAQEHAAYQQALLQGYTGRGCRVRVTHVLREPPFVPQGYAALSIRLLSQTPAVC